MVKKQKPIFPNAQFPEAAEQDASFARASIGDDNVVPLLNQPDLDAFRKQVIVFLSSDNHQYRVAAVDALRARLKKIDGTTAPLANTLGFAYWTGKGIEQDTDEALRLWKLAADEGNCGAQHNLATCYWTGINEGVLDPVEAIRLWELAADQGYALSQYTLGVQYCYSVFVGRNYDKAVHYWRLAAEQGHSGAQYCLGLEYYKGEFLEHNMKLAKKYLRLSASQGHSEAQCFLGKLYLTGTEVKKNLREARRYLRLATEQGNEEAQLLLADIMPGVDNDSKKPQNTDKKSQQPGGTNEGVVEETTPMEPTDITRRGTIRVNRRRDVPMKGLSVDIPEDLKLRFAKAMKSHPTLNQSTGAEIALEQFLANLSAEIDG